MAKSFTKHLNNQHHAHTHEIIKLKEDCVEYMRSIGMVIEKLNEYDARASFKFEVPRAQKHPQNHKIQVAIWGSPIIAQVDHYMSDPKEFLEIRKTYVFGWTVECIEDFKVLFLRQSELSAFLNRESNPPKGFNYILSEPDYMRNEVHIMD